MRWGIIATLVLSCGVGLAEDSVEEVKSKFEEILNNAKNKISVLEKFAEEQKAKVAFLNGSLAKLKKENAELKFCRIYPAKETITPEVFDTKGNPLFTKQAEGDWAGAVVPAKEKLTWELEIPETSSYSLDIFYATGGDRPCKVQVEDHHFLWAGTDTGGFSQKDFRYKTFSSIELEKGVRKLIITPDTSGPHYSHFIIREDKL
jgi:hypothetical protein